MKKEIIKALEESKVYGLKEMVLTHKGVWGVQISTGIDADGNTCLLKNYQDGGIRKTLVTVLYGWHKVISLNNIDCDIVQGIVHSWDSEELPNLNIEKHIECAFHSGEWMPECMVEEYGEHFRMITLACDGVGDTPQKALENALKNIESW